MSLWGDGVLRSFTAIPEGFADEAALLELAQGVLEILNVVSIQLSGN